MKLDNLINNLSGLFYRRKNDKNWTIEAISKGCFALTGYTREDFLNGTVTLAQMIIAKDFNSISKQLQKAIINKVLFNIEYQITHKNGTVRSFLEQGQGVYDTNGNLTALEGFIQDITKQKGNYLKRKLEIRLY
ncbi:PAS domain-containing protein [uncultured Winogradskyella sp.]|uniref:PAS domain-containing protein n=1 Tax=uncultured Winogradskyella sp. TaxID=395353 RepID=UPI0030EE4B55|tara:strand:+ start:936 stop:1337 length:402 start_codon:yes stop_codon:yes gene_type:complete